MDGNASRSEAASKALLDQGIRGIKYLDQQSRAKGEGTHNFVIFDGADVAIKQYEQGARGKILIREGQRSQIWLSKDANPSTIIHEYGHDFLEQMMRDAEHPAAPDQLKTDAATTLKWLGVEAKEDIKTRQHEKFARGFEQYLREGVAPSPELASVFARFKQWLMTVYQTIKGLGKPINEDIRQVFDRMLAAEPQRTVIAPEFARGPTLADIHTVDAQTTEPHEADAAAERVAAERARYEAELPPRIANEIAPSIQKVEAERAAAAGIEPGSRSWRRRSRTRTSGARWRQTRTCPRRRRRGRGRHRGRRRQRSA